MNRTEDFINDHFTVGEKRLQVELAVINEPLTTYDTYGAYLTTFKDSPHRLRVAILKLKRENDALKRELHSIRSEFGKIKANMKRFNAMYGNGENLLNPLE